MARAAYVIFFYSRMTEKVLILLTNNTNYLMMDGPTCDKKVLDEHEN